VLPNTWSDKQDSSHATSFGYRGTGPDIQDLRKVSFDDNSRAGGADTSWNCKPLDWGGTVTV
jgi:hypothetical protein